MPEWGWVLLGGIIATVSVQIVIGVFQISNRKAEEKETCRRDATRAALDTMKLFLEVFGKEGVLQKIEDKRQEFLDLIFNKQDKEQTSFKFEDKEQGLIDLFVIMFKRFRSEFEKETTSSKQESPLIMLSKWLGLDP